MTGTQPLAVRATCQGLHQPVSWSQERGSNPGTQVWDVGLGAAVLPLGQMPAMPASGQVGMHVTGLVDCQLNSKGSVLCGSVYVVIEEKNKTLDKVHMVIAGCDSV